MISNISNAVKIIPKIDNKDSFIKLYTNVNSNFLVGDRVYILSYNSGDTNADLDNYTYYTSRSGTSYGEISCEQYLQGYLVKEIDINTNSIVINRLYSSIPDISGITSDNFFISKTIIFNSTITGGELNGVVLKNTAIDNSLENVKWIQGIVLGGSINNLVLSDKYESMTLSLNSVVNNGGVSSYYTYNNDTYGYSVFSGKTSLTINMPTIYNGYFYNSVLTGYFSSTPVNYPIIYNGYYELCDFDNNFKFNNGYYKMSNINSVTSLWNYGILDPVDISIYEFHPIIWYDGIWESSNTPISSLTWETGVFNGDTFTSSCEWRNGIFNGVQFLGTWANGTFNKGFFNTTSWVNGIFNDGIFSSTSTWQKGTFNNGTFYGIWNDGVFNNGTFGTGATWTTGTFNNGIFSNSLWSNGTWNNGFFDNSTWVIGNWYNGTMSASDWYDGYFYNGTINLDTLWYNGIFYFGNFNDSTWLNGEWNNGLMSNSNFQSGVWWDGVFTGGNIGVMGGAETVNWYSGNFNNGYFWQNSQWYTGSFHNGSFNGIWNNGIFYNGTFTGSGSPTILHKAFEPYQKQKFIRNLGKPLNIKIKIK
jgi:hypothetical protein